MITCACEETFEEILGNEILHLSPAELTLESIASYNSLNAETFSTEEF
jgi:hypothetical protein